MASVSFTSAEELVKAMQEDQDAREKGVETSRVVPATAEAMYGDIVSPEEDERIENLEVDPFGYEMEALGLQEDPKQLREQQRAKEQKRYGEYVDVPALEAKRAQLEKAIRERDATAITTLRKEIEDLTSVTTTEGQRVKIPTPGTSDSPAATALEKSARDTARGLLGLSALVPGVDEQEVMNTVATLKSDNQYVNVGAEVLPIFAGATAGAAIATRAISTAPKLAQYIGAYLGAPAGEALLATEETSTLLGEEGDSVLQRKMQVFMEGMLFNVGADVTVGAGKAVANIPQVRGLISAFPIALLATEKGLQKGTENAISALISEAEEATTPEARMAALEKISNNIRENFEKQTGIKFDDYLSGEAELPDGFVPTLSDVADSQPVTSAQKGMERGEGAIPFEGRRERQRGAIQEQVGVTPEARKQAETAATEAREEVGARVEGRIAEEQAKVAPVEGIAEVATQQAREAVQAPQVGRAQAQQAVVEGNKSLADATKILQESYLTERAVKNSGYERYADSVKDTPIPAAAALRGMTQVDGKTVYKGFSQTLDELGIANPGMDLIPTNRLYRGTLNRLVQQERLFNDRLAKRMMDLAPGTDVVVSAQRSGKDLVAYGEEIAGPDRMQAIIDDVLREMKDSGEYVDVNISDLESIQQSIRAGKRGQQDPAKLAAATELDDLLENMITKSLTPEQAALRKEATQFYQDFSDVYQKATGKPLSDKFKFGDAISEQELAEAQAGLGRVLSKMGTDPASLQFVQDVRSRMPNAQLEKFDKAMQEFYVQDIYSKIRVDATKGEADPARIAARLSEALLANAQSRNYAQVMDMFPNIRTDIEAMAKKLANASNSAETAAKAIEEANKRFQTFEKAERATPQAKFAEGAQTTDSVAMLQRMLRDPDAEYNFDAVWKDLTPEGQDKLREGMSMAIFDEIYKGAARAGETGAPSMTAIDKFVTSNRAFDTLFPKDSAERETFNMVLERAKAVNKTGRAINPNNLILDNGATEDFVEGLIRYVQGPLSVQGRRESMAARLMFKLVGGRDKVLEELQKAFLDVRVADELIEGAKKRMQETAEDFDTAKKVILNSYLLQRLGYSSVDNWNEDVQSYMLDVQTEEALPQ